eukprot:1162068-Pelagomonas_calceolata.AAC.1
MLQDPGLLEGRLRASYSIMERKTPHSPSKLRTVWPTFQQLVKVMSPPKPICEKTVRHPLRTCGALAPDVNFT